MRIRCPDCGTSYDVPDDFPPGKAVRCARCGTTWGAEPIMPAAAEAAGAGTDIPGRHESGGEAAGDTLLAGRPAAVDDAVDDPALIVPDRIRDILRESTAGQASPPVLQDSIGFAARRAASRGRHRMAPASRPARTPPYGALAVALAAAVFAGAVLARAQIVAMVPDLASLYAAVGLPVNLRGLELADISAAKETDNGNSHLAVSGRIRNVTARQVDIPEIRIAVRASGQQEIYAWSAEAPVAVLGPGESVPFSSRLDSPPVDSREIMVRFIDRRADDARERR